MIEQGIVTLIQSGLSSITPSIQGGFAVQLPKDLLSATNPKAWTYRCITAEPDISLDGQGHLNKLDIQIDCHGHTMTDAILLARSIERILSSYHGTLSDPDNTVVIGVFKLPSYVDGYNDANRSYVRSLEYSFHYYQN